ncbi:DsbA family protein [soil metagenome]
MNTRNLTVVTAVVVALALVGIIVYSRFQPRADPAITTPTAATGELDYENQPALGAADAPVKLAVFEDFKCPACKFFDDNVFPQLERDYIDSGRARLSFVNFPFIGPDSTTAAIASECAYHQNEAAFWEYKAILYRAQGPERDQWATPERLEELAQNVGDLDAAELRACTDERRYADAVTSDLDMAQAVGVNSTPSLFVNGTKLENANDYAAVKEAIDAALGN